MTGYSSNTPVTGYQLWNDEIKRHLERIMRMQIGDRYRLDHDIADDVVRALGGMPLGGRRFRRYESPDSFATTLLRESDSGAETLAEEQRRFNERKARQIRDEHNYAQRLLDAATASNFKIAVEAYEREKKKKETPAKGFYDHRGQALNHTPSWRERLVYFLLKTPFFKER
jgi:hypothetical protein